MKMNTKTLFVILWLAAAFYLVATMLYWRDITPSVQEGTVRIVEDAENYAYRSPASKAIAVGDVIYLNHGQSGVISAFSREGKYRFSIVTTSMGNGEPELYGDEGFLYVIDKNACVFVFREKELISNDSLTDRKDSQDLRKRLQSFLPGQTNIVTLEGNRVLNEQGELLFKVAENEERKAYITLGISIILLIAHACYFAAKKKEKVI